MKEAMFWKPLPKGRVKCCLCPRNCVIPEGGVGFCSVRKNQAGKLYSLVYGRILAMAADPIEKKPLFHFSPGSWCLSICTTGCNLDCSYCQNWDTRTSPITKEHTPPERVVEVALEQGLDGIAYTYTEPTIFFEYALDIMKLARKAGLYNVWVSNGFTNPEPAMQASKYMDAVNIDLKGSGRFYRELCNAESEAPAKKTAKLYKEQGVHVEVTTLVIPGYNDSAKVLNGISKWVYRELGPETPLHFSRFHPNHKLSDAKPTPLKTLEIARSLALKAGLERVYLGNVPGHK